MNNRIPIKPPVEGASRCYTLVKTTSGDAYVAAADKMRGLGWEPVEGDYRFTDLGAWIEVAHWAIPPGYAALKERREAKKRMEG